MEKLTKQKGIELGYHRNVVANLIKRKAIVVDDVVYAPIKKRKPAKLEVPWSKKHVAEWSQAQ